MYIKIGFHKMETTVFKIVPIMLCVANTNGIAAICSR